METCRCFICGAKSANTNRSRKAYIQAGIQRDENGNHSKAASKVESRRLLRTRENRLFRQENHGILP